MAVTNLESNSIEKKVRKGLRTWAPPKAKRGTPSHYAGLGDPDRRQDLDRQMSHQDGYRRADS